MKIDKVIFGVDDNPLYRDFWPIQAKLVKEILKAEPVLFYITNEETDFYYDGYGTVKKINKGSCPGIITSFLSQIVRMYGTKYFPNDICMTSDIDMFILNSEWFIENIKDISEDEIVIMDANAYDIEREECRDLQNNSKQLGQSVLDRYPICYNIGKGKTFNKIINSDRPFSQYSHELGLLKLGWGTDELYFGNRVNNFEHGVKINKVKRKYTTPWIAERRIDRHNFPIKVENDDYTKMQKKYGIYDIEKLKNGFYIDAHSIRPYLKYKKEIDELLTYVLK